jgi:hypothetical protein
LKKFRTQVAYYTSVSRIGFNLAGFPFKKLFEVFPVQIMFMSSKIVILSSKILILSLDIY